MVTPVPGDDDLMSSNGSGEFVWMVGTPYEVVFELTSFQGMNDFAFRFGDEDNDNGHRGVDDFSGWGWVNHGEEHVFNSDWLFVARNH